MTPQNFRAIVKDEVRSWFENNQKPFARLIGAFTDLISPELEKEITRGILKHVGQVEPDERDTVVEVLAEAATALRTAAARVPKFDDSLEALALRIEAVRESLAGSIRKPSS
jgi:hypothetical protein